jgi:hypothetical protein
MEKEILVKKLKEALIYEEDALLKVQNECFKDLPGNFNEKELEQVVLILESIIVQSLNHANIVSDLIAKNYEQFNKKL